MTRRVTGPDTRIDEICFVPRCLCPLTRVEPSRRPAIPNQGASMLRASRWLVSCLFLGLASQASAAGLDHWPKEAAQQLDTMIAANANKGAYAVFDMDNTSYRYDLTEALLPFLEMKGVLTRDTLDPSLKLIPFKDKGDYKESLYSYYNRLCEIDDMVCLPMDRAVLLRSHPRDAEGLRRRDDGVRKGHSRRPTTRVIRSRRSRCSRPGSSPASRNCMPSCARTGSRSMS